MSHHPSLARLALRFARWPFIAALVAPVLAGELALAQAVTLGGLIAALTNGTDLFNYIIVYAALLLLRLGIGAIGEWQGARAAAAVRTDLRHNLYRAFMAIGPVGLSHTTSGALASTLLEKVEACDAYIARYLPALTGALVVPLFAIGLIAYYLPVAALVPLTALLLMPVLLAFFGSFAKRASARQLTALTRMGSLFADRLRNLTLLRTLGAAGREQAHLANSANEFRTRTMAVLRVAFLSAGVQDVLLAGCIIARVLLLRHVEADLAMAAIIILLTLEFFGPLRALSAAYHDRMSALGALDDIAPWLATRSKTLGGHKLLPEPLKHPSMDIMKVSYTYPGRNSPALQELSLRVEGSEFLALTGPSGSGKSTLLNLLLGFIQPDSGALAIAQQPLAQIDPAQRARLFSYIGQRTRLFDGSLADNIRVSDPQASDEAVLAAAHAARLDDVIAELPEGLNTIIGERGYGLSGGQAQRVALARAFLRNAPVLLLDEPTAGLDSETAAQVLTAIKALARERTVLMASHDAQALKMAERVVRIGTPAKTEGPHG